MRGGGGRRGDERVAHSVRHTFAFGGATWGSEWRQGAHPPAPLHTLSARASGAHPPAVHTHLRHHPSHHQPSAPAGSYSCQLTVSVSDSSPPPSVAAVVTKVEQRPQRLPPRASLPSALGLAAVKPRPPHALSLMRIRCCEKTVGLTSLAYEQTTHLSLPCPTHRN
jgi:hypothetical protein